MDVFPSKEMRTCNRIAKQFDSLTKNTQVWMLNHLAQKLQPEAVLMKKPEPAPAG